MASPKVSQPIDTKDLRKVAVHPTAQVDEESFGDVTMLSPSVQPGQPETAPENEHPMGHVSTGVSQSIHTLPLQSEAEPQTFGHADMKASPESAMRDVTASTSAADVEEIAQPEP